MIRAVISDDEPLALDKLRRFLAADGRVTVSAEAVDGYQALEVIERDKPDLVFLDVQMPGLDGFEVVDALQLDALPRIVFVTAHDEYAVRAFEMGAVDYLLKPVDGQRFAATLDRVLGRPHDPDEAVRVFAALDRQRRHLRRFVIRDRGRTQVVPVERVEWIEAAGNYLKLHVGEHVHLVRGTMGRIERRLDPERFVRVHRSTIVNLDRVTRLVPRSHGDQTIVLTGGATVTLSRRFRRHWRAAIGT